MSAQSAGKWSGTRESRPSNITEIGDGDRCRKDVATAGKSLQMGHDQPGLQTGLTWAHQ